VARGEVVAFTDDDTVPDPEWLLCASDTFVNDRATQAAYGCVRVPLPAPPTDYERDAAGLETAGFVTANCFVRRSALEVIGGFDERFATAWREDTDLLFRLLHHGYVVRAVPDAVVLHPVRPASWGVSLRQQRKGSYDALLYKTDPELFARFVHPARPVLYYIIVLALTFSMVALARGATIAAGTSAVVWAGLTGRLAARRLSGTSRAPRHVAEMILTSMMIPVLSLFWRVRGAIRHRVVFW
jgi:cellulose synthase/poly-beta-1,6-N-acetylglucosamine synthase-like glycosyltransferase